LCDPNIGWKALCKSMFLLSIFSYWSNINFQPGDDEDVEKHIGKYAKGCQKNEKNSNNEHIRKDVEDVKEKPEWWEAMESQ
jgi:hypothetical protein